MIATITHLEGFILLWIQGHIRMEWLNPIMIAITSLGNSGFIWKISAVALLISKKTRKIGLTCLLALVFSYAVNNMLLKNIVARPRPFAIFESLMPIIHLPRDLSFPSGHAAASFACAWVMFRKLPKIYGVPALILAVLIALSRLYVGVHYPTDVLAGIISGIVLGYLAEYFLDATLYAKKAKRKKEQQTVGANTRSKH